ncbi:uncharacterized protein LOC141642900 [Silene latifolia]|uniref:uncharacterized protein LOC141642900 n=1 Tax=Silene latifolia TaxID=37657 RepID=UPI003D779836
MPSVRMKKASMCCIKDKSCLRVCHKSNTISKRSQVKISQLASEDGSYCQNCQEESSSSESNIQDPVAVGVTKSDEFFSGEDIQFKQPPRLLDDSALVERMELPPVSSTKLETIFSPTLSQMDGHNFPNSCNGVDFASDPFHLSSTDESDGNSGSSSDYQSCNISDFYVSDMIFEGSAFDGSFLCDGIAETLLLPEHGTTESNILFDVSERHLMLPSLDDSVETSEKLDSQSSDEGRAECDDSSFLLAIHQIRPGDQDMFLGSSMDSDEAEYFDPHSFIRNLPDLSEVVPSGRPTILPKESRERKPVTLVLDLDETLVHSTLEHCESSDFTFTVFFNMKEHIVYVKERPHLRTFLKRVAEMFEVVVFTASQSIYAEQLLDILDSDGKLISGRAYRESCIFSEGTYTKDLTVLGLDLAKVLIIDNSPQVFRLQVNNGIPIKSWFDDPLDNELISLIPFLETLVDADDVRPLIAKRFGNKE